MDFKETKLKGVYEVATLSHEDERGSFSRVFCPNEFVAAGIDFSSTQINLSTNPTARTLRGMHYQDPPFAEAKFVRAVRGEVFDVVVDLRTQSETYLQWVSVVLSAVLKNGVFIPEGCAHGFLTLVDDSELLYQMSMPYVSGKARGYRWDDPAFGIDWPETPARIGEADKSWLDFT